MIFKGGMIFLYMKFMIMTNTPRTMDCANARSIYLQAKSSIYLKLFWIVADTRISATPVIKRLKETLTVCFAILSTPIEKALQNLPNMMNIMMYMIADIAMLPMPSKRRVLLFWLLT